MPPSRLAVANLLTAHGLRLQRLTIESVCAEGRWHDYYTVHFADRDGRTGQLSGTWTTLQRELDARKTPVSVAWA